MRPAPANTQPPQASASTKFRHPRDVVSSTVFGMKSAACKATNAAVFSFPSRNMPTTFDDLAMGTK